MSKPITIGFLNPIASNESLGALQSSIEATGKALGATVIAKDAQLSVDKQVSQFGQLLAQNVNAIIVQPEDPKALGPLLKQAKDAGVPVVGLDVSADPTVPLPPEFDAQLIQGRDQQAYSQVEQMAKADPNGKIGLIGIGAPVPALKYLLARETFYAKQAGLTVLGEQDNPTDDIAGGQRAATSLLSRYGDMTGIIGYNDPSALGALAAARTSGQKIVAVGLNGGSDGLDGVRSGRLAATVQLDVVGIGQQAVYAAYDLATKQGGTLPRTVVRPPTPVSKDTVDSVTTWSDQISKLPASIG